MCERERERERERGEREREREREKREKERVKREVLCVTEKDGEETEKVREILQRVFSSVFQAFDQIVSVRSSGQLRTLCEGRNCILIPKVYQLSVIHIQYEVHFKCENLCRPPLGARYPRPLGMLICAPYPFDAVCVSPGQRSRGLATLK